MQNILLIQFQLLLVIAQLAYITIVLKQIRDQNRQR